MLTDAVDDVLSDTYVAQYPWLVHSATVLLDDVGAAEEVTQEAYLRVMCGWANIRDHGAAAAYLRTAVLNMARSRMRRRLVAAKHLPEPLPDAPSAEDIAINRLERDLVRMAVRRLPRRQRECVVLRYYGDLTEAQIAATLGISTGSVKSHTSRGISAIRRHLGDSGGLLVTPGPATPHVRRVA